MNLAGNLPDAVWSRLKSWVLAQRLVGVSPSLDDCLTSARRIIKDITGSPDKLPVEVVAFYAAEMFEMGGRPSGSDACSAVQGAAPG